MPPNNTFNPQQNKFPSIETVAAPTPLYKNSQFAGGGYQVGDPVKQIGKTTDEQNYINLAEIAAGTSKSLDTFGSIGSAIDKSKIERAGIEWEKINQNEDYSLEDKQKQLEEIFKNTNTPILGSNWKDQLQIQADKNWNSKEARNQFEQTRYTEEFAKYLKDNPGLIQTPKVLVQFDKIYENKYPSSSSNTWFILKKSGNTSEVAQNTIKNVVNSFAPQIETAFSPPSSAELDFVETNPESPVAQNIRKKFSFFFEHQEEANTMSPTDFRQVLHRAALENLKTFMGNIDLYTDEIQEVLLGELPNITARIASDYSNIASDYQLKVNNRDALAYMGQYQGALIKEPSIANFNRYLSIVIQESGNSKLTEPQREELIVGTLPQLIKLWDDTVLTKDNEIVLKAHPNWSTMTPVQKVDAVLEHFRVWTTGLHSSHMNALQRNLSIKHMPTFLAAVRTRLLTSPETATATSKDFDSNIKPMFANLVQIISTRGNSGQNSTAIGEVLTSVANRFYIDVQDLMSIAYGPNGELDITKTPQEWLDSITDEERKKRVLNSGILNFNASQFMAIKDNLVNIDQAVQAQLAKGSSGTSDEADKKLEKAAEELKKFTAIIPGNRDELIMKMLNGTLAASPENAALKETVIAVWQNTEYLERNAETMSPEARKPYEDYLKYVYTKIPELQDVIRGIQNTKTLFYLKSSSLIDSIPTVSEDVLAMKPEDREVLLAKRQQEMDREIDQVFDRIVKGTFVFSGEPFIGEIVDKDGTWSAEARMYLLQAAVYSQISFDIGSEETRKNWKVSFDKLTDRIGTFSDLDLREDKAKLDLVTLNMMSREFKTALDQGRIPLVEGAGFFRDRAILGGNWSQVFSADQVTRAMNSSDFTKSLEDAIFLPVHFLRMSKISRQFKIGLETGMAGSVRYIIDSDTNKLVQAMLNAAGIDPDTLVFTGGVGPRDKEFSIDNSITIFRQLFGKGLSEKQIANSLEKSILGRVIPKTTKIAGDNDISTEAVRIRTALIALQTIVVSDPTLFLNVSDTYFQAKKDESKALIPTGDLETDLDMFLHVLGMGIELHRDQTSEGAINTPFITGPVSVHLVSNGTSQETGSVRSQQEFTQGYDIRDGTDKGSYSHIGLVEALNTLEPFRDNIPKELKKFKPLVQEDTEGNVRTENGTNYQFGALLLANRTISIKARIELLRPWMDTIKSTPYILFEGIDPDLPLGEWLFEVNSKYIEYGGLRPFIKDGVTKEAMYKDGGAALQQIGTRSKPKSIFPTWFFITRDFDGNPALSLNNESVKTLTPHLTTPFLQRQEKEEEERQRLSETEKQKNRDRLQNQDHGIGKRSY